MSLVLSRQSLLARLCETDVQFIMLEIAWANWLDKTWLPLSFKWSLDQFRPLTLIKLPWFMKWKCFSQQLSFKFLFTSATFLRYLLFLAVILDIDTSQFLFTFTTKLMVLSPICWGSCFVVTSFVLTWSVTWISISLTLGCM